MNEIDLDASPSSDELQGVLSNAVDAVLAAPPPRADIDAWRKRYPSALAWLNPQRVSIVSQRRKRMKRTTVLATTAAVAICVGLGLVHFHTGGNGASAAETVKQIQKAKTIIWKGVGYQHISTKDGKHTWVKTHVFENAYKAPGMNRTVSIDDDGTIESVEICNTVQGRRLEYYPRSKKATLSEFTPWTDDRGPFTFALEKLNAPNLQWVGKRATPTGEINVFRTLYREQANDRDWSMDFWIDAKTKQLVATYLPGADIYDPEHDRARDNPPATPYSRHAMGGGEQDIRYDVSLDDSLFRLEPPEGYTVEVKVRPHVTEKEMIDYLGIIADFNDKTFLDQLTPFYHSFMNKLNQALKKPEKELSAVEKKLLDTDMDYIGRGFRAEMAAPLLAFFYDSDATVEKSLRYMGKGVKLGDKDRIVCWYKLKDAKDSTTYRVVYGDLSVKDVAAKDLPLPVEP